MNDDEMVFLCLPDEEKFLWTMIDRHNELLQEKNKQYLSIERYNEIVTNLRFYKSTCLRLSKKLGIKIAKDSVYEYYC